MIVKTWDTLDTEGILSLRVRTILRQFPQLAEAEAKILVLIQERYKNGEIALILGLAPHSVDTYVSSIRRKLDFPKWKGKLWQLKIPTSDENPKS